MVTFTGKNSVKEMQTSIVDISQCGLEVWGNLTLRGTGSLTATGSQCGIHVMQEFAVDGCTVNARADGVGAADEMVAGVIAGSMVVRGGGRVVATGACSEAGVRAYGLYLLDGEPGDVASYGKLDVNTSWLDVTGTDGGVACLAGSLTSARFVTPAGGGFGAGGVVDSAGVMAAHVVVEPAEATPPAGETDSRDAPGDVGKPATGDPAAGQTGTGSSTDPVLKPETATPKTTTTIKTTVTKTTVSTPFKPKTTNATTTALPKTGDNCWISASITLFLLGITLLGVAHRF